MMFPIPSGNLVLESSASSTTFKPFYTSRIYSYMKVVRRSLLSLFIIKVLFYELFNRERESCVGIMRQHNFQSILYRSLINSYMKVVRRSLLSFFTLIQVLLYEVSNPELESRVGNLRQHNIQIFLQKFYSFIYESCKTYSAIIIHYKSFVQ